MVRPKADEVTTRGPKARPVAATDQITKGVTTLPKAVNTLIRTTLIGYVPRLTDVMGTCEHNLAYPDYE